MSNKNKHQKEYPHTIEIKGYVKIKSSDKAIKAVVDFIHDKRFDIEEVVNPDDEKKE